VNASPDYGDLSGAGSSALPGSGVQAGIVRGRDDEFRAFVATEAAHDPASAALIARVGRLGVRNPAFRTALGEWVRERDRSGRPVPPCVAWQRVAP
jgi:hypothetical protein